MQSRILLVGSCLLMISCNLFHKKEKPEYFTDHSDILLPDSLINNINVCTEVPNPDSLKLQRRQVSVNRFLYWARPKTELFVSFIDGDPVVEQKVQQVAKEWENYCGMTFIFLNSNDTIKPDITISFKQKGSWSLVGTDSKKSVPSMNLGWLTPATSDEEYHRVVLHEFGHALGLVHEHQNPKNNTISWNKDYVYAYYKQVFGWSAQTTYYNFFAKYKEDQMRSSDFDPTSIMMYEIPATFTANGFHTNANTKLSETDKKWIGYFYPKR